MALGCPGRHSELVWESAQELDCQGEDAVEGGTAIPGSHQVVPEPRPKAPPSRFPAAVPWGGRQTHLPSRPGAGRCYSALQTPACYILHHTQEWALPRRHLWMETEVQPG